MSDSADTIPVVSKKRKSSKSEPMSTTGGDSYKPGELPVPEGSMEAKKRRLVEIIFDNSKGLKADELAEQVRQLLSIDARQGGSDFCPSDRAHA